MVNEERKGTRRGVLWPLRVRLTVWYTVSLAGIILLFATFLYWQLQRVLLAQMDAGLQVAAAQALLQAAEGAEAPFFRPLQQNQAVVGNLYDSYQVYLLGADGRVWDGMGNDDEAVPDPALIIGYTSREVNGERWRVYSQPVTIGRFAGWLQLVQELNPVEQMLESLLTQMAVGVPIALGLAGVGGYFLASRALRPIDQITRTAQTIHPNDLHRRIGYTGPADEVGRLAATFDQMLARLQTAFARERRFTADAAHELRTPLTALKGRIGVTLNQSRSPAVYHQTLQEMEQQVDRLIRLSSDLLLMARLEQGLWQSPMQVIDLGDFLPAVVDQIRPLAEAKTIHLSEMIPPQSLVRGQLELLIRLFLNLLDNAIKYTPTNGQVAVEVGRREDKMMITIRDSGPGIAPHYLPHLFERFYRIEADRARLLNHHLGGAGLGLAIAQEIARVHGGMVTVTSEVGKGSAFTVWLNVAVNQD